MVLGITLSEKFYKQTTLPTFTSKESDKEEVRAPIPEKIGPYKIETLLAKGGISLLYLGIEPETKQVRVIKVLSPKYVNNREMMEHFLWEAKIIGMTNHPNIVKVFDYGPWEEGVYIAMEFIRGVSLRQFLMQQSFSLKRSLDIILQVAYALSHLHSHGVIHRDLKPENILIAEDGEVKVIDFGIAQLHEEGKPGKALPLIGTPSYMSPEQKEDPSHVSFSSDIYALGIITYELVLGKLSYGIINLSYLPAGLQKIVGKALSVSPKERYQNIVEFITDLTNYYKSPEIEKDRPGGDQILEMLETLQKEDQALSTFTPPNWSQVDIGIAKESRDAEFGLYLDFFKFANNTMAIVLIQTKSSWIASSLHVGVARGIIKSLMQPHLTNADKAFSPTAFATTLNNLMCSDYHIKEKFFMSVLKIIPMNDSLSFLSCGLSPLFHISQGTNSVRMITTENPLIGENPNATFIDSGDNWNDGDLLVFHSFPFKESLVHSLQRTISKNVLLSPMRLCKILLEDVKHDPFFDELRKPKLVLSLQRLG